MLGKGDQLKRFFRSSSGSVVKFVEIFGVPSYVSRYDNVRNKERECIIWTEHSAIYLS